MKRFARARGVGLRRGNLEVLTNFLDEVVVDFVVFRHGRRFNCSTVNKNRMLATLTEKLTAAFFEMANEVASFHYAAVEKSSLMTLRPLKDSSANARFASRTSSTASCKFSRVSSRLAPCVFAPGNS